MYTVCVELDFGPIEPDRYYVLTPLCFDELVKFIKITNRKIKLQKRDERCFKVVMYSDDFYENLILKRIEMYDEITRLTETEAKINKLGNQIARKAEQI